MKAGELLAQQAITATPTLLYKAVSVIELTRLQLFNADAAARAVKVYLSIVATPTLDDTEVIQSASVPAGQSVTLWGEESPILMLGDDVVGVSADAAGAHCTLYGIAVEGAGGGVVESAPPVMYTRYALLTDDDSVPTAAEFAASPMTATGTNSGVVITVNGPFTSKYLHFADRNSALTQIALQRSRGPARNYRTTTFSADPVSVGMIGEAEYFAYTSSYGLRTNRMTQGWELR